MRRIVSVMPLLAAIGASLSVAADLANGTEAYERGDYATALREFRTLAEQGNAAAQYKLAGMFNLGTRYIVGEGVPEDAGQAAFWLHKAAEQGFADAQFALGFMHVLGEGVPEDVVQAYAWFSLAAASGHEDAQQGRARIRHGLTSAQIAEAEKLSRQLGARIAAGRGEPETVP